MHKKSGPSPTLTSLPFYRRPNTILLQTQFFPFKYAIKMKPIVLAMIICDHYYRDVNTGKSVISGTFSTISSASFPSNHGNCAVYIALTDVASTGEAQLEFRKEGGGFSMQLPPWSVGTPDNRRAVVEIGGNINGLPLPQQGDYEFVLKWNGQEIAQRHLNAFKMNVEPPRPKE